MLLSDQYDASNARERNAARALKSALVGIFLLPLQFYTAWLVILVFLSDEPLRQRYFWYGVVAAVVMAIHLPLSIMLLTAFLFGSGVPWSEAEI